MQEKILDSVTNTVNKLLGSKPIILKEFIQQIRESKTLAEEKGVIAKESALIRQSFKNNEDRYRHRNISKLLYLSIAGYDTDFGQLECLKLISSSNYKDKRLGYIALSQLFSEQSQLLIMVTNQMRSDLMSEDKFVIGLTLNAFCEVATPDMCLNLHKNICSMMGHQEPMVGKKAALAAIRVVTKCGNLVEEILPYALQALEKENHGQKMCGLHLSSFIVKNYSEHRAYFNPSILHLAKTLSNLTTVYSVEFEINGITDPFLHIAILSFFGLLVEGQPSVLNEITDALVQVLSKGKQNTKSAVNAVQLECVKTISAMDSASTLRKLGVQVLGRFLGFENNNSKYVCLHTLKKLVNLDYSAVQEQELMVLECLKVNDPSIQKSALELIFLIMDSGNSERICTILLEELSQAHSEIQQEIVSTVCQSYQKIDISNSYRIRTLITLFSLSDYLKEENMHQLMNLIQNSGEDLSSSLTFLLEKSQQHVQSSGLAKVFLWTLGECAKEYLALTEEDLLMKHTFQILSLNVQDFLLVQYAATCLVKVYAFFTNHQTQIKNYLFDLCKNENLETQERAIEYVILLQKEWDQERGQILAPMPLYDMNKISEPQKQPSKRNTMEDLMDIFESTETPQEMPKEIHSFTLENDDLNLLFSCQKESNALTHIVISIGSKVEDVIEQVNVQCAGLKYLKLQMKSISGTSVTQEQGVEQKLSIENNLWESKATVMKIRLTYQKNQENLSFESVVNQIDKK